MIDKTHLVFFIICAGVLVVAHVARVLGTVGAAVGALALAGLVEALLVRARVLTRVGHAGHI
jgi:hypothetical protein